MTPDVILSRVNALKGLVPEEVVSRLFIEASKVAADLAIVEIGSYKGKSTCALALGARHGHGAHVWAVDPWDLPGNVTGRFGFAEADTLAAFLEQVKSLDLSSAITPVQNFSLATAASWMGPRIGLLYIDGDHSYESVRDDFAAWLPHLAAGATVVFDDYDTPRNPGVAKAVGLAFERELIWDLEIDGRLAVAKCR